MWIITECVSPHTHAEVRTLRAAMCAAFRCGISPWLCSASSLPVIYLQAFLTFPLAFPSFLPLVPVSVIFLPLQHFGFLFILCTLASRLFIMSCCVLSPFFLPLVFMSVFSHLLFILFSFIFPSSSLTSFLSHALVYILLPLHPPRPLAFLPVPLNSPCFSLYYFISPLLSDFYLVVKSMRQRG